MNYVRYILLSMFLIMLPALAFGQTDHYDSGGKLIAVIACVAIILIGVFAFLFYLERRIKKVEDDLNVPR